MLLPLLRVQLQHKVRRSGGAETLKLRAYPVGRGVDVRSTAGSLVVTAVVGENGTTRGFTVMDTNVSVFSELPSDRVQVEDDATVVLETGGMEAPRAVDTLGRRWLAGVGGRVYEGCFNSGVYLEVKWRYWSQALLK